MVPGVGMALVGALFVAFAEGFVSVTLGTFLVGVGYSGPGSYNLSAAQRSQALSLKNDLQHYDGSGNC